MYQDSVIQILLAEGESVHLHVFFTRLLKGHNFYAFLFASRDVEALLKRVFF